eukprot:COSAG04_NODE_1986_length_5067_cov_2.041667_2_plen_89_part_00
MQPELLRLSWSTVPASSAFFRRSAGLAIGHFERRGQLYLVFSGVAPDMPPPVWARLSEETWSLMEYAHVLHTKPLAAGWVDSFYSARL